MRKTKGDSPFDGVRWFDNYSLAELFLFKTFLIKQINTTQYYRISKHPIKELYKCYWFFDNFYRFFAGFKELKLLKIIYFTQLMKLIGLLAFP